MRKIIAFLLISMLLFVSSCEKAEEKAPIVYPSVAYNGIEYHFPDHIELYGYATTHDFHSDELDLKIFESKLDETTFIEIAETTGKYQLIDSENEFSEALIQKLSGGFGFIPAKLDGGMAIAIPFKINKIIQNDDSIPIPEGNMINVYCDDAYAKITEKGAYVELRQVAPIPREGYEYLVYINYNETYDSYTINIKDGCHEISTDTDLVEYCMSLYESIIDERPMPGIDYDTDEIAIKGRFHIFCSFRKKAFEKYNITVE